MDKNTLFGTLVIFCITCFIGFNLMYLPKIQELRSLREMQMHEKERSVLVDEIAGLEKKVTASQERSFPRGKEEIELLNLVRDIANESQVRVTSMVPQQDRSRKKKRYQKISLIISFETTYHQFGDFISKIENAEKFMKIDTYQFSTDSSKNNSEFPLSCEVALSVFAAP